MECASDKCRHTCRCWQHSINSPKLRPQPEEITQQLSVIAALHSLQSSSQGCRADYCQIVGRNHQARTVNRIMKKLHLLGRIYLDSLDTQLWLNTRIFCWNIGFWENFPQNNTDMLRNREQFFTIRMETVVILLTSVCRMSAVTRQISRRWINVQRRGP